MTTNILHHNNTIVVKSFSTKTTPKLARDYYNAHISLLKKHRLLKFFHSANEEWLENDMVYGVVIMTADGSKILGGGRIECFNNRNELPIYQLIGKKEPFLKHYINSLNSLKVGEITGVWKEDDAREYGVSVKLILKSIFCLMKQIPLDYVFGLSSHKIFTASNELGARKVKSLGDNGIFHYSKFKIPAAVYYFDLNKSLDLAFVDDRNSMKLIMKTPNRSIHEKFNGEKVSVRFELDSL